MQWDRFFLYGDSIFSILGTFSSKNGGKKALFLIMIEKNKFAKKKCTEEEKQNQQNTSKYLKIQSRKLYKKANNCFCFAISDSRCCDFWCVILLKMEKMGTSLVRKWDQ